MSNPTGRPSGKPAWGTPPPVPAEAPQREWPQSSQPAAPPAQPPAAPNYGYEQPASTRHSRRAAKSKVQLEPAPDVKLPEHGWAKFVLWYNRKRNIADPKNGRYLKVPPLGRRDKAKYDAELAQLHADAIAENNQRADYQRYHIESMSRQRLSELTDKTKKGTIGFVNTKGAAATTTTTVNVACILAWETHTVTIVLDANPAAGTSAARLGKDHDQTITVQQLDQRVEELGNFDLFIAEARPNRYFVRSVSAESVVDGQNPLLEAERLSAVLALTKQNCEYLLVDTANVITDEVTLRALSMCDVLVFTANVAVPDSLRKLADSMQALRKHGLKELVENSVVVISNIPSGHQLEEYRKFMDRTNMQNEVVASYTQDFHGAFVGIPHDDEISRDRVVDIDAWKWETRQAYREALICGLEQLDAHLHPVQPVVRQIGRTNPPTQTGQSTNATPASS